LAAAATVMALGELKTELTLMGPVPWVVTVLPLVVPVTVATPVLVLLTDSEN